MACGYSESSLGPLLEWPVLSSAEPYLHTHDQCYFRWFYAILFREKGEGLFTQSPSSRSWYVTKIAVSPPHLFPMCHWLTQLQLSLKQRKRLLYFKKKNYIIQVEVHLALAASNRKPGRGLAKLGFSPIAKYFKPALVPQEFQG